MNPTFTNEHPQRTQQSGGRGAETESRKPGSQGQRIMQRIDMDKLMETVRKLGADAIQQTKQHPQIAVGVGVGVGFIAGSLLGSRMGQMLCAVGLGYLIRHATVGNNLEMIQRSLEKMGSHTR